MTQRRLNVLVSSMLPSFDAFHFIVARKVAMHDVKTTEFTKSFLCVAYVLNVLVEVTRI